MSNDSVNKFIHAVDGVYSIDREPPIEVYPINERLDKIEERLDSLENNLERLVAYINIRFSEITEGFCRREENTSNHLKELEERIEKISFEYDRNADE